MKKFEYNKLIRHKIVERMHDEGLKVNGKNLSHEDYIKQLKHKIVEEANEVFESETKENLMIELADVIEVIHAIADANNIDMDDIENKRLEKRSINGHFTSSNYIHYIEVDENDRKLIEYLENKNRPYRYVVS